MSFDSPDPDRVLEALGNPVRREIVRILAPGGASVGQIAAHFPCSRPAVSKHLRLLAQARLVVAERQGTRNVFRLNPDGFDCARSWLESFWDAAGPRFAALPRAGEE